MVETVFYRDLIGVTSAAADKDTFIWELMRAADRDKNGVVTDLEAASLATEVEGIALTFDKEGTIIDGKLSARELLACSKFLDFKVAELSRALSSNGNNDAAGLKKLADLASKTGSIRTAALALADLHTEKRG